MRQLSIRRAGMDDAAALVVLRAAMFQAMGADPGPDDAPWRSAATSWFRERLAEPAEFAAFVSLDDDRPVSAAAIEYARHAPHPRNASGGRADLFNVSTLPAYRGQGRARRCVDAALGWVQDETDARVVRLQATSDGIAMYRALGFAVAEHPTMRLPIDR